MCLRKTSIAGPHTADHECPLEGITPWAFCKFWLQGCCVLALLVPMLCGHHVQHFLTEYHLECQPCLPLLLRRELSERLLQAKVKLKVRKSSSCLIGCICGIKRRQQAF
jgi:hypothetical protein